MTYVIAEIGVNHDGDARKAWRLVDEAARAGCDAVKFQLFDADTIDRPEPVKALLRGLQLTPDDLAWSAMRAKGAGMDTIVTPFGDDMLDLAERMGGWDAYKVSHAESGNVAFVERVVSCGKPVYASYAPGAILTRHADAIPLWCCPKYPTPIEEVDWEAVGRVGGFSDHTGCVEAGGMAAAAGARVIEFHITEDRLAKGPDHASSISVHDARRYVRAVRECVPCLR